MRDIDDLPEDVAEIAKAAQRRVVANSQAIASLTEQGAQVDTHGAKFQHFLNFLVEANILSEEQYWTWSLAWEESLTNQLNNVQQQVNAFIAKAEEDARKAMLTGGIVPSKLLRPGNGHGPT